MKQIFPIIFCLSILIAGSLSLANFAHADEVKVVGVITKIQMAPDGKSATAILKDNKSGENVAITITDDLTLDKFKDHRIVEGDEIRCKYEKENGKNNSKLFKKTAGG